MARQYFSAGFDALQAHRSLWVRTFQQGKTAAVQGEEMVGKELWGNQG